MQQPHVVMPWFVNGVVVGAATIGAQKLFHINMPTVAPFDTLRKVALYADAGSASGLSVGFDHPTRSLG